MQIFTAVTETHKRIEGAYAVVAMLTGKGIVGFRDPHGVSGRWFTANEKPVTVTNT